MPSDCPSSTRKDARSRMTLRCVPVQKDFETFENSSMFALYCCRVRPRLLSSGLLSDNLSIHLGAIMSVRTAFSKLFDEIMTGLRRFSQEKAPKTRAMAAHRVMPCSIKPPISGPAAWPSGRRVRRDDPEDDRQDALSARCSGKPGRGNSADQQCLRKIGQQQPLAEEEEVPPTGLPQDP